MFPPPRYGEHLQGGWLALEGTNSQQPKESQTFHNVNMYSIFESTPNVVMAHE